MSHEKVIAFCEPNKCKVEVAPKTETDAVADKVDKFDSRIMVLEKKDNGTSVTSLSTNNTYLTSSGLLFTLVSRTGKISSEDVPRTISKTYVFKNINKNALVLYIDLNNGHANSSSSATVTVNGTQVYYHTVPKGSVATHTEYLVLTDLSDGDSITLTASVVASVSYSPSSIISMLPF